MEMHRFTLPVWLLFTYTKFIAIVKVIGHKYASWKNMAEDYMLLFPRQLICQGKEVTNMQTPFLF